MKNLYYYVNKQRVEAIKAKNARIEARKAKNAQIVLQRNKGGRGVQACFCPPAGEACWGKSQQDRGKRGCKS